MFFIGICDILTVSGFQHKEVYMRKKFTYAPKLYLGKSISEKKLDKIKKKLENKLLLSDLYLLTLAHNPQDQLEFFQARQLAQLHYKNSEHYVIGIAGSRGEALKIIETITMECLQERGDCSLREYLLCQRSS